MAINTIEFARITKELVLNNICASKDGENLSILASASHGTGKTQIFKQVAKELEGYVLTVDGSTLKEGEITGLPIPMKYTTPYGEEMKCDFVPHHIIANIKQLERLIFETAKKDGFLNGRLKINDKGETIYKESNSSKFKVITEELDLTGKILAGDQNKFKFGEDLSFEIKKQLIENSEIKPVILFIDEINRADKNAMSELMNILLGKIVNGYKLPWWVATVSAMNPGSQNTSYIVNSMDPAHMDRFIKLIVNANFSNWADYALENNHNKNMVMAISAAEAIFQDKDDSLKDTDPQKPSPRSWSVVSNIMNHFDDIMAMRFFTSDERREASNDFREILNGIVGETTARMFMTNLNNTENNVKPTEIITGETPYIDQAVKTKLLKQKPIHRKIMYNTIADFLMEHVVEYKKLKKNPADKNNYIKGCNIEEQIKEYFKDCVDNSLKIYICQSLTTGMSTKKAKNGGSLYLELAEYFTKDYLEVLKEFKARHAQISNM